MKIGIDIRQLEGIGTGIGRYLTNFISHAAATRPGHTFYLYGNQHTATSLFGDNTLLRLSGESITLWWDQVVLPSLARADGVEVFLSPYAKGPGRVDCPLITTIHDLLYLKFPEYTRWYQRPKNALLRQVAVWVSRRASVVLTVSNHAKGDIQTLLGVDETKIRVLPNSVDDAYRPVTDAVARQQACARYGIERPYVYYLGSFKPHKNVQSLLRAFASFPTELRGRYQLVLGGARDKWLGEHRQLAVELGIEARTRFVGPVAEEDMPALYSAADLFVFPSLYEGFGLPPLEAMACGTAVVASERTAIPEVVGDAGLLVDPCDLQALADTMIQVLQNEEKRLVMEARGLERAEGFRVGDICERQMCILEQVAAEVSR